MGKTADIAGNGRGLGETLELQAEQQLLRTALDKVKRKAPLNVRETRAIKKHEKARDEERLLAVLRRMPQKIVRTVFGGVHCRQLQDYQARWDLPLAGEFVDWFSLGPKLWALLVKFGKHKAASADPDGELFDGASKSLKDEWLKEKIRIERMKADEMEKKAIYWDQLQPALVDLGTGLRKAGDLLQRQFGPDAAGILDEAYNEFDRKVEQTMGGGGAAEEK